MGRFYKTSRTLPVDYMYKVNAPLMAKAAMMNDQYITNEIGTADKINAFKFDYAPQDEQGANRTMQSYHNAAANLSQTISADPANWRKQSGSIRGLTQDLQNNYADGDISKYMANAAARKAAFDGLDKQVALYSTGKQDKAGNTLGVNPVAAKLAKNYMDNKFGGTFDKDGNPREYSSMTLMNDINVQDRLGTVISKMKDDGYSFDTSNLVAGGRYFNDTTKSEEGLSGDKIVGVLNTRIQSDPQLRDYLMQRQQIGEINGVKFDHNGNLASPIVNNKFDWTPEMQTAVDQKRNDLVKNIKDPTQRQAILDNFDKQVEAKKNSTTMSWDQGNYLAPVMQSVIQQYAHSKTKESSKLRDSSSWSTVVREAGANSRASAGIASRERIAKANLTASSNKWQEEFAQKERFHADAVAGKTGKGAKSSAAVGVGNGFTPPTTNQMSEYGINNLSSFTVPVAGDPSRSVPQFSAAGLANTVINKRNDQANIIQQLKTIDNELAKPLTGAPLEMSHRQSLKGDKVSLQRQLDNTQAELTNARNWYGQTEQAVLSNDPKAGSTLSDEFLNTYKDAVSKYGGMDNSIAVDQKRYAGIKAAMDRLQVKVDDVHGATKTVVYPQNQKAFDLLSSQLDKISGVIKNKVSVKNSVAANKDTYLKNVASTQMIRDDAVIPNQVTSNQIQTILFSNLAGNKILDNDGNDVSDEKFHDGSWLFKNHRQTYNMNFEGGNNTLADYIKENDIPMEIQKVGGSLGAGNGEAGLKVVFKDPSGRIPIKPYYISLNSDNSDAIGKLLAQDKDPAIRGLGMNISDKEASVFKTGVFKGDRQILMSTGDGTVPFHVERGLDNRISVTYPTVDKAGKIHEVPFPRVRDAQGHPIGGEDGFYTSTNDFLMHYNAAKEAHKEKIK